MDWLKAILEKAKITDGKLDIEGLMNSIKEEFPKNAVPKTEFNALNETKKTLEGQLSNANKQIEDFKTMDVDGIKKAADDWKVKFEESDKNHKAELEKIAYNSAAEKFIDGLKPKDALSRSAILSEFAKKEFKRDGDAFQGATEWAEAFKKDNAAHFEGVGDTSVSTGGGHGDPLSGDVDKFVAAAMKGAGIAAPDKQ